MTQASNAASSPAARFNEAMKLHVSGDLAGAENAYRALLAQLPDSPDVNYALGAVLLQQGKQDKAIASMRAAVQYAPANPRFSQQLAQTLKGAEKPKEAAEVLVALVAQNPGNMPVFIEAFNACMEMEQYEPMIPLVEDAVKRQPHDLAQRGLACFLYQRLERYKDAMPHMQALYEADANRDDMFHAFYIKALRDSGFLHKANDLLEVALKKFPQAPELLNIKATHLYNYGRHEDAIATYQQALALDPTNGHIRASIGLMRMMLTDLKEGYEEYSARPNIADSFTQVERMVTKWTGQPLEGKTLLIWTEQGIGDIIMFASLLPYILAQGPKVTILLDDKLTPLFKRSFPQLTIIRQLHMAQTSASAPPPFDYHLPMGEMIRTVLPHYHPAEHPPYLKADEALTKKLRARYEEVAKKRGAKRIVGISWFTKNENTSYRRDIPLSDWGPLFSLPHVQFVSLQYGKVEDDIKAANKAHPGALYQDPEIDAYANVDGLASQIMAMDEVISIQNATVHLAGSLGAPTTIMLNAASDWRWGLNRTQGHWYGSVQIERQDTILEWQPVLERIRARLEK